MAVYIDKTALLQSIANTVILSTSSSVDAASEARGAGRIITNIKNAPAVDAVVVVRCENCKHFLAHRLNYHSGWCGRFDFEVKVADFCSFGVRDE